MKEKIFRQMKNGCGGYYYTSLHNQGINKLGYFSLPDSLIYSDYYNAAMKLKKNESLPVGNDTYLKRIQ